MSSKLIANPEPPVSRALADVPRTEGLAPRLDRAMAPDDWRRLLTTVRAYKWLVLGVTVVGTVAGVIGAGFLKPTYQARATVWIEIPDPGSRDRDREQGPIQTGQLIATATGWLDLLRSHVVLDDVVARWRLYLKPKSADDSAALTTFTLASEGRPGRYRFQVDAAGSGFRLVDLDDKVTLQRGRVGDAVGSAFGFAWVPPAGSLRPGAKVDFTLATPSEAAVKFSEELRVRVLPDGNFVRIELRGPDPATVTGIVNAVVERFVAAAADLKRERLTELTAILKDQLDHAQQNLRTAEGALTRFRVQNAVRSSEGPAQGPDGRRITADPTFASYVDLQVEASGLARDRAAIERVLARAPDSGIAVDELAMIGAVGRSSELTAALKDLTDKQAELRALRFRYADTHPPVRRLAAQVDTLSRRVIPDLGRAIVTGLAARERELRQRSDSIAGDLHRAPPLMLDELRLAREQTNAELLFSNLQHRYEEARLAEVSTLPDVRVLERAVRPSRPTSNTAPLLIIVALLTSLSAGVAGAAWLDRGDPRMRYPDQVTRSMGLPILGAVPHVPRSNGKRRGEKEGEGKGPGLDEQDGAAAVEALRGIRLNVQHAYGAAGPLLLTVTSPGRGEGKSFVTCNLAMAFAEVNYRTLLIDGDVRLGALHRLLRAQRRPGLTDVLAGRVPAEQAVQATEHPLLSFVGAGSRMHRGPELLGTAAVPRLITAWARNYDVVLVDTAPLAAGVDPYALGTATGNILLVLRTGVTERTLAEAKIEVLHRLPIRLLGAVLNDVRPGATYSYYGYALTGYEVSEEDPGGVPGELVLPDPS
jgi:polysaccharide biosynthesis transport protein